MFRYLVLGLLRDGQAYHGYALMKVYRERSGVSISTGNFYRELQRLVSEALVQTVVNPEGADARRAPYQITERGAASFEAWLTSTPTHIGGYDDELSSRAVFIGEVDAGEAQKMIDRWREAVWIYGKTIEREREEALAATSGASTASACGFNARAILLARRLRHVAADLEFIEELRSACTPASPVAPAPPTAVKPRARPATAKIAHRRATGRQGVGRGKKAARRR
jgi:DNA-binding PadR family transcriptional regulator